MTATYVKGRLYKLKVADLQPDPAQARKFMDPISLNELTASIENMGVLTPIQFRQSEEAILFIVSGHRRVEASKKVGLTDINGTFTDGDTRLQGFVENIQREELRPIDEAEEMAAIMKEYVLNQYQLADAIGKSKATVSEILTLNKLPEDIRSAARTNPNITRSLLLEVARQKTESNMRRKFQTLMERAAKAGTTAVKKLRPSAQRALLTKTDVLTGELMNMKVPWQEWSEDDRNDLINALHGICRQAKVLLTDMNAPLPEEEPEAPGNSNLA